uniref:Acyl-CoA dehydrogenase/oxidase N-terminal domain-containing protein n=1 Tax=Bionectria ochroleuca TaxID=29856 RepID=A0A8H7KEQ4_BIOOC
MAGKTTISHPFGNPAPFAESDWYNVLESPYYNESHRKLRAFVRDYLEKHVVPIVEEWEETGEVPLEEIVRWARSGLAFQVMPEKCIGLPAGTPEKSIMRQVDQAD